MGVKDGPRFHVIVVVAGHVEWLTGCLGSVMEQTVRPARLTVLPQAGAEAACRRLAGGVPGVQCVGGITWRTLGEAFNRMAATMRQAEHVVILRPDAVPAENMLERLAEAFAYRPHVGVLGCTIFDASVDRVLSMGLTLEPNGLPRRLETGRRSGNGAPLLRAAEAVEPVALAIRGEAWCELGGLNPSYNSDLYATLDLCRRAREADWGVAVAPEATVTWFGEDNSDLLRSEARATLFEGRARYLWDHLGDVAWISQYLPAEARWLLRRQSDGMRWAALTAMMRMRSVKRAARRDGRPGHV